jgi:DNA polymerase-3 subunit gamma/tau
LSERAREALEARRERFAGADLLRMLQAIGELEPRFRKSGQQQLLIETLLVRFALLDRSIELAEVLRSLGSGGSSAGSPPSSPARREAANPSPVNTGGGAAGGGAGTFARAEFPQKGPRADGSALRAEAAAERMPETVAPPSPRSRVEALDLSALTGRWDALVERLRTAGKPMLATALEHSLPVAVSASGVVTIALDEPNDIYGHAINTGRADVVTTLREWFAGIERVELRRDEQAAAQPPKRLTDEMVRAERLAALKKRDPVLGAAIDALDLDVAD